MGDNPAPIVPVYNITDPNTYLIGVNKWSITKLTVSNYLMWRFQVRALLKGHKLHPFIDNASLMLLKHYCWCSSIESGVCPLEETRLATLQCHARISLSHTIQPVVARAVTTRDIWTILLRTYGTTSRGYIKTIKQQLKCINKGSQSVTKYMHSILTKT
ncbi:Retrovirus-related Pol polyprotein from transposon RE1 [Cardamine amara subsp. amara]|uniref:Retrovirus-related Pol polyprotein from transposon RE1 n=1 Tax=Cardamine amara subsp. amara TaxID=228776 RepID=A0ABD1BZ63_CARAN